MTTLDEKETSNELFLNSVFIISETAHFVTLTTKIAVQNRILFLAFLKGIEQIVTTLLLECL